MMMDHQKVLVLVFLVLLLAALVQPLVKALIAALIQERDASTTVFLSSDVDPHHWIKNRSEGKIFI